MEWLRVWGRFLSLLLLMFLAEHSVTALDCVEEPDKLEKITLPTEEVALFCQSRNMWSNEHIIHITRCTTDKTVESGMTCPGTAAPLGCDTATAPQPNNTQVNQTFQVGSTDAGYYLTCAPPSSWVSGALGVVTQCVRSAWTPVHDFCDTPCSFPRCCADVANLGFTATGEFDVILTGKKTDPPTTVTCRLSEVRGDTGWVVVLRYAFPVTKPDPFNNEEPSGNYSEWNYFIGYKALEQMSWNADWTLRIMILRLEITLASGLVLFTEYSRFHLSNDGKYKLLSKGDPHGTVGDILSGNLGQEPGADIWWKCPSDTSCTWVTWDNMTIPAFDSPEVTRLVVLVRPQDFDTEVACPPVINYSPHRWSSNRSMDMSRAPGSTANYTCGPYLVEGANRSPDNRTTSANIVCLQGTNGGTPYWSFEPQLPCTFACPAGFTKAPSTDKCVQTSTAPATGGMHGAALACGANETSLALVGEDGLTPSSLEPEVFYYTGHTMINGTFKPALPGTFACAEGEECNGNDINACLAVRVKDDAKTLQYRAQNCSREDTNYLCMWPGYCPRDFSLHEGLCYKVIPPVTTLTYLSDALTLCNNEGAGLAYPETLARLTFIGDLVKAQESYQQIQPANVVVGLNDRPGDWTMQGLYTPDTEVLALAGTSSPEANYRLLQVSDTAALTLLPDTLQPNAVVHYAACQLHGVRGCWTDPPPPGENMEMNYNHTRHLRDEAIYSCFPGYFVEANISMKAVAAMCLGELGGWTLNATLTAGLQCLGADACTQESLPVPSSTFTTNTTNTNHLWLNGTVTYTCPANMATAGLNTTQNVTCTETAPDTYAYVPAAVAPCEVCLGVPSVVNAATDWSADQSYTQGMQVTATCLPTHTYNAVGNTTQMVSCDETGWSVPLPCFMACLNPPPVPGPNMTQSPLNPNNTIETQITYTCDGALKTLPNDSTTLVASLVVTCNDSGEWDTAGPLPPCLAYCESEPTVPNATTTWVSTEKYAPDAQVNVTCIANHLVDANTTEQTIQCTEGSWTAGTPCVLGCTTDPPLAGAGMTAPPVLDRQTGASLNYTCLSGSFAIVDATKPAVTFIEVTCDANGLWAKNATTATTLPDCLHGTMEQPVLPDGALLSGADPPYVAGSVLTQTCGVGYASGTGATSTTHTFDGTQWMSADPTFECLPVPDLGKMHPGPQFVSSGSPPTHGAPMTHAAGEGGARSGDGHRRPNGSSDSWPDPSPPLTQPPQDIQEPSAAGEGRHTTMQLTLLQ